MSDRPLECSSEEHKLSGRTDHGTGWEHYNDQSQQEKVLEGKFMMMCSLNVRHISKIIHTSNLWKVGRVKGEMIFSRVVTKSLFLQQVKAVVLVTFDVVMDCRHCCYFNGGEILLHLSSQVALEASDLSCDLITTSISSSDVSFFSIIEYL